MSELIVWRNFVGSAFPAGGPGLGGVFVFLFFVSVVFVVCLTEGPSRMGSRFFAAV